jgi:hypothetical protein
MLISPLLAVFATSIKKRFKDIVTSFKKVRDFFVEVSQEAHNEGRKYSRSEYGFSIIYPIEDDDYERRWKVFMRINHLENLEEMEKEEEEDEDEDEDKNKETEESFYLFILF